jgi:hypothetical protein
VLTSRPGTHRRGLSFQALFVKGAGVNENQKGLVEEVDNREIDLLWCLDSQSRIRVEPTFSGSGTHPSSQTAQTPLLGWEKNDQDQEGLVEVLACEYTAFHWNGPSLAHSVA